MDSQLNNQPRLAPQDANLLAQARRVLGLLLSKTQNGVTAISESATSAMRIVMEKMHDQAEKLRLWYLTADHATRRSSAFVLDWLKSAVEMLKRVLVDTPLKFIVKNSFLTCLFLLAALAICMYTLEDKVALISYSVIALIVVMIQSHYAETWKDYARVIFTSVVAVFSVYASAPTKTVVVNNTYHGPKETVHDLRIFATSFIELAITGYMCSTGLTKGTTMDVCMENAMKRLDLSVKFEKNIDRLEEMFVKCFNDGMRFAYTHVLGKQFIDPDRILVVDDLIERAKNMASSDMYLKASMDVDSANAVKKLYTDLIEAKHAYRADPKVMTSLNAITSVITNLHTLAMQNNAAASKMQKKCVPIVLTGPSQIGKSFIINDLAAKLCKIAGKPFAFHAHCPENEFVEAYNGECVWVDDEAFQQVDSEANPNPQFMEFLRIVNTIPYKLHMAAVHQKGNTIFTSDFYVATTNVVVFNEATVKSIHDRTALTNRFEFYCHVSLIPEVKRGITNREVDQALDLEKLRAYQKRNGLSEFDFSHLIFTVYRPGQTVPVQMTYDQLIVQVSLAYRQSIEQYDLMNRIIDHVNAAPLPVGTFTRVPDPNPQVRINMFHADGTSQTPRLFSSDLMETILMDYLHYGQNDHDRVLARVLYAFANGQFDQSLQDAFYLSFSRLSCYYYARVRSFLLQTENVEFRAIFEEVLAGAAFITNENIGEALYRGPWSDEVADNLRAAVMLIEGGEVVTGRQLIEWGLTEAELTVALQFVTNMPSYAQQHDEHCNCQSQIRSSTMEAFIAVLEEARSTFYFVHQGEPVQEMEELILASVEASTPDLHCLTQLSNFIARKPVDWMHAFHGSHPIMHSIYEVVSRHQSPRAMYLTERLTFLGFDQEFVDCEGNEMHGWKDIAKTGVFFLSRGYLCKEVGTEYHIAAVQREQRVQDEITQAFKQLNETYSSFLWDSLMKWRESRGISLRTFFIEKSKILHLLNSDATLPLIDPEKARYIKLRIQVEKEMVMCEEAVNRDENTAVNAQAAWQKKGQLVEIDNILNLGATPEDLMLFARYRDRLTVFAMRDFYLSPPPAYRRVIDLMVIKEAIVFWQDEPVSLFLWLTSLTATLATAFFVIRGCWSALKSVNSISSIENYVIYASDDHLCKYTVFSDEEFQILISYVDECPCSYADSSVMNEFKQTRITLEELKALCQSRDVEFWNPPKENPYGFPFDVFEMHRTATAWPAGQKQKVLNLFEGRENYQQKVRMPPKRSVHEGKEDYQQKVRVPPKRSVHEGKEDYQQRLRQPLKKNVHESEEHELGEPVSRFQAWNSANSAEINTLVRKAMWTVCRIDEKNDIYRMGASLQVFDRWILINRHFIEFAKTTRVPTKAFRICKRHTFYDVPLADFARAVEVKRGGLDTDVLAFRMSRQFPLGRDLRSKFIDNDDASTLIGEKVVMSMTIADQVLDEFQVVMHTGTVQYMSTEECEGRTFYSTITTDIRSETGYCGGIYVIDSKRFHSQILGVHFIGAASGGSRFQPILQKDLRFLDGLELEISNKMDVGEDDLIPPAYDVLGTVPDGSHTPTESKLVQSSMTHIETKMAPACLEPLRREDGPGLLALRQHPGKWPDIDEKCVQECVSEYFAHLISLQDRPFRIYDNKEAVLGDEDDPFFAKIDVRTSAGYPWMHEANALRKPGKKLWFGDDGRDVEGFGAQEVFASVDSIIEKAKKNVVAWSLYTATLKDEKRPIEKVMAKKTRLFTAAAMDYSLAYRRYFGSALSFFAHNRIYSGVCVGINPTSREWDDLARYLKEFECMVAGDFTRFDTTLNNQIMYAVCDLINRLYDYYGDASEEDNRVRKVLWENIVHAKVLYGSTVYQQRNGQPSGNPGTAVTNSIYNVLATMYVFKKKAPGFAFFDHVKIATYGDDNIMSVSSEVRDVFNQLTLTAGFADIGMIYTNESKTEATEEWKGLGECTFLKRAFKMEFLSRTYLAPLSLDSILEMPCWYKKSLSEMESVKVNVETAVRELYLHDEVTFNRWSGAMSKEFYYRYNCHQIRLRTWKTWLQVRGELTQGDFSIFEDENVLHRADEPLITRRFAVVPEDVVFEAPPVQQNHLNFAPDLEPLFALPPERQPLLEIGQAYRNPRIRLTKRLDWKLILTVAQTLILLVSSFALLHRGTMEGTTEEFGNDPLINGSVTKTTSDVLQMTTLGDVPTVTGVQDQSTKPESDFKTVRNYEISTFLARPIEWPSSVSYTPVNLMGQIMEIFPVNVFLGSVAPQVWKDKLRGIYAANFTLELIVQVNPQPFQGGILGLGFYPHAYDMADHADSVPTIFENYSAETGAKMLPFFSGNPGIAMNLCESTEMHLSIPWVGQTTYYDLRGVGIGPTDDYVPDFGAFYLWAVTPLVSNSPTDVLDVQVFMRVKEFEPIGATYHEENTFHVGNKPLPAKEAHSTSVIGKGMEVAKAVSNTPIVAALCPEAPALVDAVAGVTSLLGFSKPDDVKPPEQVAVRTATQNMTNVDGIAVVRKLAASRDQTIEPHQLGIVPEDEMHIKHIATKENLVDYFNWTTTDLRDAVLYETRVEPNVFGRFDSSGQVCFPLNHLYVAASMFKFWTGAIEYSFNAAATKFHTGRLRISMRVGYNHTDVTKARDYCYQEIWDIHEGTLKRFVAPYVNVNPYKEVAKYYGGGHQLVSSAEYVGANVGNLIPTQDSLLTVSVVIPLRAAASAATSIPIVVGVKGGDDISFATPHLPVGCPFPSNEVPQPILPPFQVTSRKSASNNSFHMGDEVIEPLRPFLGQGVDSRLKFHIGECVTSARQLVKKDMVYISKEFLPGDNTITPFIMFQYQNGNTNFLDYLANFFRFYAGSMRLTVSNSPNEGGQAFRSAYVGFNPDIPTDVSGVGSGVPTWLSVERIHTAQAEVSTLVEGPITVTVPYQSQYHQMPTTTPFNSMSAQSYFIRATVGYYPYATAVVNTNAETLRIYRGAGDDFSFGYLVGCPWGVWEPYHEPSGEDAKGSIPLRAQAVTRPPKL